MIEEIIEKAKKENKKVYVYAHKFPDGDAISSSCAIVEYLKNQGIEVKYVVSQEIKSYGQVVGTIPVTTSIEKNQISIILDTSTVDYAENKLFTNSSTENTYIIDHHEKAKNTICIEDELNLPKKNVIRNSNASSTCEILVDELNERKITPQIANMLTLGLLTDTAKLKFLKTDTLKNLSKLIIAGAKYEEVINCCNRKSRLRDEVGLAKILLRTQKFQIGDTFGIILPVNNREVNELSRTYGVRNPQKKIFKMSDIENCSFNCMIAENTPSKYDVEFRSTPIYGNFNVFELAAKYGGGGHYSASGCSISPKAGLDIMSTTYTIKEQASKMYSEQGKNIPEIPKCEYDKDLSAILTQTNRLTKNVTPLILSQVDKMIKNGANYEYTYKKMKTFETFMLENEILSRIPNNKLFERTPVINISLSPQDLISLERKYGIKEEDILNVISVFENIDVRNASITLPDGRKSQINDNGKTIKSEMMKNRRDEALNIEK